jgi:23S rRNA pseudouridine2605 synthase
MTEPNNTEPGDKPAGERIAKVLARAGVGSRRDVEEMIAHGRIALNGDIISNPATFLTNVDGISVDGKAIAAAQTQTLYRFHKPRGVITTHKDPQGRRTVFSLLPKSLGRLVSIGRLDLNSEGLLLLTNDGALAHALEDPNAGIERIYRVRAHGRIKAGMLESLEAGITVEGVSYGPIKAEIERQTGQNSWLIIKLEEGKNREIRKVLAHLGLTVNRLIRTDFGSFKLGKLPREGLAIVPPAQAKALLGDMGLAINAADPPAKTGWAKAKPKKKKPPAGRRRQYQAKHAGKGAKPSAAAKPGPGGSRSRQTGPNRSKRGPTPRA